MSSCYFTMVVNCTEPSEKKRSWYQNPNGHLSHKSRAIRCRMGGIIKISPLQYSVFSSCIDTADCASRTSTCPSTRFKGRVSKITGSLRYQFDTCNASYLTFMIFTYCFWQSTRRSGHSRRDRRHWRAERRTRCDEIPCWELAHHASSVRCPAQA